MRLGVNIDHVATVRQARRIDTPDPVQAAVLAEIAGADFITVHLREDRRHIQDRDLRLMKQALHSGLNLELALSDEIVEIALEVKPAQVTFVPERREEITTEGGLDVKANLAKLKKTLPRFHALNIHTSLFIDATPAQIDAGVESGAQAVELHTGRYCEAETRQGREKELAALAAGARYATQKKLRVYAGHGLNYHNVKPVAAIKDIEELNIGHALIGHAIFVGLERAVGEMKQLILEARGGA